MKNYIKHIMTVAASAVMLASCSFLEPLPNGAYTDENFDQYPELLRGFTDKLYNDYRQMTFYHTWYIGFSAISDEAVYTSETETKRVFSEGKGTMTSNPFDSFWSNNYAAINYANLFLKDNRGYETQYMLNQQADLALRRSIQGDAYGMRAWMLFGLLRLYAGEGVDGKMYGVPILTDPTEYENIDKGEITRATIDECCEQILKDCDSAYVYLKNSNRDFPEDPSQEIIVTGSARYTTMDQQAIDALRAQTYLYWASPAWNPEVDQESEVIKARYEKAAFYAAKTMKFKLDKESTLFGGFDPMNKVMFDNPNSQEIIWCGHTSSGTTTWETNLYPKGFGGSATIVPTQALVDCFPAANGYPISDSRSNYNPNKPYENRDPRFYSTINYDGAEVLRNTTKEVMYTFNTMAGGPDSPGLQGTSATGYYIKKFLFTGWNPYDAVIQDAPRPLMHYRWTEMCLIFAEAASHVVSPTDDATFGYSAKQALSWLRGRTTTYDMDGLGKIRDPYLDECASAGGQKFLDLVKNEWKVETCFEGQEFYNSRRWATSVDDINVPIQKVVITGTEESKTYSYETVTTLNYPTLWIPLPYLDVRRCPNLIQNKGYDNWK